MSLVCGDFEYRRCMHSRVVNLDHMESLFLIFGENCFLERELFFYNNILARQNARWLIFRGCLNRGSQTFLTGSDDSKTRLLFQYWKLPLKSVCKMGEGQLVIVCRLRADFVVVAVTFSKATESAGKAFGTTEGEIKASIYFHHAFSLLNRQRAMPSFTSKKRRRNKVSSISQMLFPPLHGIMVPKEALSWKARAESVHLPRQDEALNSGQPCPALLRWYSSLENFSSLHASPFTVKRGFNRGKNTDAEGSTGLSTNKGDGFLRPALQML